MRVSRKWLQDFLPLSDVSAEEIAGLLTAAGTEVEGITCYGEGLHGALVVQVAACLPHPSGRAHLHVVEVDAGGGRRASVVCGAPNVEVGALAVWARPGARLAGGVLVGAKELHGTPSEGVLCSALELGVGPDHEGILLLPPGSACPGQSFEEVEDWVDDVLELSITPNRPDLLSVYGVARELGVLLRRGVTQPDVLPLLGEVSASHPWRVDVERQQDCPAYVLVCLGPLSALGGKPLAWRRRLERHGLRSVHPWVDATNLVLLGWGQPTHAFDAARVEGEVIEVRRAREGEELDGIDHERYTLSPQDLVIADRRGPIALAGVMGGERTEVSADTERVLLESALFAPALVRRSAKTHGLHTDASHRFERGVDPAGVERAPRLIAELVGLRGQGVVLAGSRSHVPDAPRIAWRDDAVARTIGAAWPATEVLEVFERLGCRLEHTGEGHHDVMPPTWRADIVEAIDLVEEAARVFGFDRVPSALPPWTPGVERTRRSGAPVLQARQPLLSRKDLERLHLARTALRTLGYAETVHVALTDQRKLAPFAEGRPLLRILQPLNQDLDCVRTSLLPGLMGSVAFNVRRRAPRVALFELAKVPGGEQRDGESVEAWELALALCGDAGLGWHAHPRMSDAYELLGTLQALAAMIGVRLETRSVSAASRPSWLHPGVAAELCVGDAALGWLGMVHPDVAELWDLETPVYAATLGLSPWWFEREGTSGDALQAPVGSLRDLAIVVPERLPWDAVAQAIEALAEPTLAFVQPFDVYAGEHVEPGMKSLALRFTYAAAERTLADAEVSATHRRVTDALLVALDARQR